MKYTAIASWIRLVLPLSMYDMKKDNSLESGKFVVVFQLNMRGVCLVTAAFALRWQISGCSSIGTALSPPLVYSRPFAPPPHRCRTYDTTNNHTETHTQSEQISVENTTINKQFASCFLRFYSPALLCYVFYLFLYCHNLWCARNTRSAREKKKCCPPACTAVPKYNSKIIKYCCLIDLAKSSTDTAPTHKQQSIQFGRKRENKKKFRKEKSTPVL